LKAELLQLARDTAKRVNDALAEEVERDAGIYKYQPENMEEWLWNMNSPEGNEMEERTCTNCKKTLAYDRFGPTWWHFTHYFDGKEYHFGFYCPGCSRKVMNRRKRYMVDKSV